VAVAQDELADVGVVAAELPARISDGLGQAHAVAAGTRAGNQVVAVVDRGIQVADAEGPQRHVFLPRQDGVAQAVGDLGEFDGDISQLESPARDVERSATVAVHAAADGVIVQGARDVGRVGRAVAGHVAGQALQGRRGLEPPRRTEIVGEGRPPGHVVLLVVGAVQVPLGVQVVLLEVGEDQHGPGGPLVVGDGRRQRPPDVVVVVHGQADLLEVVGALGAEGRLARLLDGRHRQADQHRDDGDHHQHLDQGEAAADRGSIRHESSSVNEGYVRSPARTAGASEAHEQRAGQLQAQGAGLSDRGGRQFQT
jgi:hypothetical protein